MVFAGVIAIFTGLLLLPQATADGQGASVADADPGDIDWAKVVAHWDLPFHRRARRPGRKRAEGGRGDA